MGGSRGGSVGSYSSGSANNVDVAGKYGADDTKGKIAKVQVASAVLSDCPVLRIHKAKRGLHVYTK